MLKKEKRKIKTYIREAIMIAQDDMQDFEAAPGDFVAEIKKEKDRIEMLSLLLRQI